MYTASNVCCGLVYKVLLWSCLQGFVVVLSAKFDVFLFTKFVVLSAKFVVVLSTKFVVLYTISIKYLSL